MNAALLGVMLVTPLLAATSPDPAAPVYSAASIANPIANVAEMYSPDSFITIYGRNLAYTTRSIGLDDIRAGALPTVLIGTGVRVLINHIPANIFYVSPTQVNLLAPSSLTPGPATLQLVNDTLAGPEVNIVLEATAPVLFRMDGGMVLAAHLDGTLVTPIAPARRGELVVVYVMGLGVTVPPAPPNRLTDRAAWIGDLANFRLLFNGLAVDSRWMLYVGASPPYPGVFQINLVIPDDAPDDPEIKVGYPDHISPPAGRLVIR